MQITHMYILKNNSQRYYIIYIIFHREKSVHIVFIRTSRVSDRFTIINVSIQEYSRDPWALIIINFQLLTAQL